jgi:hypothetical protein
LEIDGHQCSDPIVPQAASDRPESGLLRLPKKKQYFSHGTEADFAFCQLFFKMGDICARARSNDCARGLTTENGSESPVF